MVRLGAARRGALEGVERVLLVDVYPSAAALLASMYPSVFPVAKGPETAPPWLLGLASALANNPGRSNLLPPFPAGDLLG
jgi:hypothetical protein